MTRDDEHKLSGEHKLRARRPLEKNGIACEKACESLEAGVRAAVVSKRACAYGRRVCGRWANRMRWRPPNV